MIILPNTSISGARNVAESIRKEIASEKLTAVHAQVTASLGLANWPAAGLTQIHLFPQQILFCMKPKETAAPKPGCTQTVKKTLN